MHNKLLCNRNMLTTVIANGLLSKMYTYTENLGEFLEFIYSMKHLPFYRQTAENKGHAFVYLSVKRQVCLTCFKVTPEFPVHVYKPYTYICPSCTPSYTVHSAIMYNNISAFILITDKLELDWQAEIYQKVLDKCNKLN